MVRDARRDMAERHGDGSAGGVWNTLSTFTPFPFLLALCGQISSTMIRRAPDLMKRTAGATRDCVFDAATHTHGQIVTLRLTCTRTGQRLFYRIKMKVETTRLPGPLAPLQSQVAVPLLRGVEGLAQFVTSEELPELYFVAKNSMRRSFFLRHVVLPPLGAAESVVRYVVIFPSHIVFPSREEIEDRTDLFLEGSTTRVQALVEHLYSATEVLDQHLSMVQWNILGRGPYESLSASRRSEVIRSVHQRMRIIASHYKLFEFLATIKLQNEMLYNDLQREFPGIGGVPLTPEQVAGNAMLTSELAEQDANAFPIWFYKKPQPNNNSSTSGNPHSSGGWIEFSTHESRRLERKFRWYQQQKVKLPGPVGPSNVVLVDEGRHEVDLECMRMTPVYWPELEEIVVCRSRWVYAQRNYGLAPYNPEAAAVLESAFVYYMALYPLERQRLMDLELKKPRGFFSSRASLSEAARATRAEKECTLSVPVEGHLVEFKGVQDIMQYKRLLAGTTPFTSKRRVYRGDPRVRTDPTNLQLWKDAMVCDVSTGKPLVIAEDDNDIEEEVDHLVLIVHGIGDALKTLDLINVVTLRSIIDCATTLRELNREALCSAHFAHLGGEEAVAEGEDKKSSRQPRVEFLPIEWHSKLHMDGLDQLIHDVTLPAIPKLRELANDTVLDVLFFMSPLFHQVILDEVAKEMNRVFTLFQSRHPDWMDSSRSTGPKRKKVSIIAHSLGSIICFDILNNQQVYVQEPHSTACTDDEGSSDEEEVSRLFNIYHPYDPVAYRIEPILNPLRAHSKAAIIRTFEGKLRFQYQLRNSFRAMWSSLRHWRRDFEHQVLAGAHSVGLVENPASMTPLSDVLAAVTQPYQVQRHSDGVQAQDEQQQREEREGDATTENVAVFGRLCQGLPVDYSLQENEIEIANEYLFALTAHVIYWGNRDANLFVAQKLILEPAIENWPISELETVVDRHVASEHKQSSNTIVDESVAIKKVREKEEATASSEVSSGSDGGFHASLHRRRRGGVAAGP
ncbi:hypothetical protein BBO99_00006771 [Phytophthora kernoviae]|uniref:DDHD domain-containing protein n=2 Tax=Phytophthora kernoviae TaxID=325452 RepID=A0A3R7K0T6_9STRA|nr:hypothetical protein G195_009933 [Phytophthora kernoviae 00238/432]KAG2513527.1 hypothetical protein JM16_006356 [Phytophthora kernoviae]KAG2517259.1 hypothetical protein JM18_005502 [Phytophthora kernoviae]RLN44494.1 hypothetical protein BBI17_006794 [Phytophthora kernoviae]RLN77413.1 hypothetical protein BBO99_00006771 [Phytophthora kernoviae]